MSFFVSASWLLCAAGQANAAPASQFLKFRSESELARFEQAYPAAQRVHPKLLWLELNAQSLTSLSQSQAKNFGVIKVENDSVGYRIPKPRLEQSLQADVPNNKLWGINKIHSTTAWAKTQGSEDVVVAVVDTGIDFNHPALNQNMWVNQAELNGKPGVDDDGNGYVDDIYGADFISGHDSPLDDEGHGSHVAGTIAGFNPADKFFGVAPHARVMAVKTHNTKGEGSKSSVVKGILYAADMGARVLNCSWGGAPEADDFDQLLFDAIQYANKKGAVLIAAAGNESENNDVGPHYPANYDLGGIVSVAASDSADHRAYFSNYGPRTVDLAAPGSNIWSVLKGGKSYVSESGTSMATPHVAGAAALLASTPEGRAMSAEQMRDTLMANVEKMTEWSNRVISGGRLDVSFIGKK